MEGFEAPEPSPAEKLAQAFELMSVGFRLKRQTLQRENPSATAAEVDALFLAWLLADE